jgi:hypothetical protein
MSAQQLSEILDELFAKDKNSTMSGVNIYPSELSDVLRTTLEEYSEEIAERSGQMQQSVGENPRKMDEFSDAYMKQLSAKLEMFELPEASRAFVIAQITAIAAGANEKVATSTAWHNWRHEVCPAGAAQYDAVLALKGTQSAAWKAFYAETKDVPLKKAKSKIISASKTGLKFIPAPLIFSEAKPLKLGGKEIAWPVGFDRKEEVKEAREIGWGGAVNMMRAGEFDLSNKDKLIAGIKSLQLTEAGYFLKLLKEA